LPASDAILDRLLTLHPRVIDLSLDRMTRILAALDHPERRLPPVIHVAGTNGKGSVVAYLDAMLRAAGRRSHVYTSPHLVRFHERIAIDGAPIAEEALAALLDECERVNAGEPITFFEITTAAALLAFARTPADACLLEVGLGGRLDATNVVDRPLITIITPVALDHQQYLGDTIEAIAAEKAGIMRRGVPVIIGPQEEQARRVIVARAEALGAPYLVHGQDFAAHEEHGRLVYQDTEGLLDLPLPALAGRHQIDNAAIAIAAARALRPLGITESSIEDGLRDARWPARLQRLTRGPLVARAVAARPGTELWLDGGHNPHAARALAQAMAERGADGAVPLHLICGMLETKDATGFFRAFTGLAKGVTTVPITGAPAAVPAPKLAGLAAGAGIITRAADSIGDALDTILAEEQGRARVLICGSLYLAGDVLRENG
jgi:dihydrofolate synthase/folylpolyglutamate synthase